jgi:hypothetical protein
MFHNPSCFIFQHVSDPSIFYLSPCFTSLQVVGDWRVPCRPVLRCSRFHALLKMYVSITIILNVTPSSSVDSYQRFERTQYLTLTLKMAAARFSETLAHMSVHVFRLSRLVLIKGQSSGFWHSVHMETGADVSCLQCYSGVIQLPFRSRQHATPKPRYQPPTWCKKP